MNYAEGWEWLQQHESGWQFGESGVLQHLGTKAGVKVGCEVGIGDSEGGLSLAPLIESGMKFVGMDSEKSALLSWGCKGLKGDVTLIHARVRSTMPTIEQILSHTGQPEPDILTIDVDSVDYFIWRATMLRPLIVMVEHAADEDPKLAESIPVIPNEWECGYIRDLSRAVQANFPAVRLLAKSKGYTCVAWNKINGIYVRNDHYDTLKG